MATFPFIEAFQSFDLKKVFHRVKMENLNININNARVLFRHGMFGAYLFRFHLAVVPDCTPCSSGVEDNTVPISQTSA